jgi:1-acyl-sn-glycerol-3-phosphate acyltransferase
MAHLAKAAVCPMAVVGARDAKPVGAKHSHNKPVWFKMGRFIHFDELGVKKRRERLEAMEVAAWDAVLALRDELREEHPGEY